MHGAIRRQSREQVRSRVQESIAQLAREATEVQPVKVRVRVQYSVVSGTADDEGGGVGARKNLALQPKPVQPLPEFLAVQLVQTRRDALAYTVGGHPE
jgi:hypothetical protein